MNENDNSTQFTTMKTAMWKMMIALAVMPVALASCHDDFFPGVTGHGDVVTETISMDDFDGFVSTISADVILTQGDKQEVVVEAQQNIIDNIDFDHTEGGIWTIHYKHPVGVAKPVKIYITIPTLTQAGIAGSGEVTGTVPFTGLDELKLFISGSGSIDLEAESAELNASITGSGDMRMAGITGALRLIVTGSGSYHGRELVTPDAELTISGSGSARLTVEEHLKVVVTGSGNVYYSGNPEVDVHVTGSGSVTRQ
jgi:hypothetical protein